jgi:hypothetical protein
MAAIGAASRINQRQVDQDRKDTDRALADAETKLKDPQKYQLNAQQVTDLQKQKEYLTQRKEALREIWLSPATTAANFAFACIRSGNPADVQRGENFLRQACSIRPEIKQDPFFLQHYRDAYMELARKTGRQPVIPPLPGGPVRPPEVNPNPNPNPTPPRPEVNPNPNPNPNPPRPEVNPNPNPNPNPPEGQRPADQTAIIQQIGQVISGHPLATLLGAGGLIYLIKRYLNSRNDAAANPVVQPSEQTRRLLQDAKVEPKEELRGKEAKVTFKEKKEGGNGEELEFKDGKFKTKDGREVPADKVEVKIEVPPGSESEMKAHENRARNKAALMLDGKGEYAQFLSNTKVEGDASLKGEASKLVYRTKDGGELEVIGVKDGKLILKKGDVIAHQDKVGEGDSIVLKVNPDKVADATTNDRVGNEVTKLALAGKSNIPGEKTPAEIAAEERAKLEKEAPELKKAQEELQKKLAEAEQKLKEADKLNDAESRRQLEQNLQDMKRELTELNNKIQDAQKRAAEVEKAQGQEAAAALKQQIDALSRTQADHQTRLTAAETQMSKLPPLTPAPTGGPGAAREVISGSGIKVGLRTTVGDNTWTVVGGEGEHVVVSNGKPITVDTTVKPYDKDKMVEVKLDGREGKFVRHTETGEIYSVVNNAGSEGVVLVNGLEAHGKRSPVFQYLRDAAAQPAQPDGGTTARPQEGAAFSEAEKVKLQGEIARDLEVKNGVATFRGQSRNLVAEAAQSIKEKKEILEKIEKQLKGETNDPDLPTDKTELAKMQQELRQRLGEVEAAHSAATGSTPDYTLLDRIAQKELPERLAEAEMARRGGREIRPGNELRPGGGRWRAALYLLPVALAVVLVRPSTGNGATLPPVYAPTIPSSR